MVKMTTPTPQYTAIMAGEPVKKATNHIMSETKGNKIMMYQNYRIESYSALSKG